MTQVTGRGNGGRAGNRFGRPCAALGMVAMLAMLLATGGVSSAADLAEGKIYEAVRADKPPVIDGKLDEAVWQQAQSSGEFWKLKGPLRMQPTTFQIAYDGQNLYLAITNFESSPDTMRCDVKGDDTSAVMGDEANEWFFQPEPNGDYYQFAGNCLGTKYDALAFDPSWNAQWQCAAARGKDAWTLECAIAFSSFGRFGVPGAIWGLNVCRDRQAGGDTEWSAWSPTPGGFHQPGKFGKLIFGGKAGGVDRGALIESARAAMKSMELERRLNEAMQTIRTGNLASFNAEERKRLEGQLAAGDRALEGLAKLLAGNNPLDTRAWIGCNAALAQALEGLEEAAWHVKFEQLLGD